MTWEGPLCLLATLPGFSVQTDIAVGLGKISFRVLTLETNRHFIDSLSVDAYLFTFKALFAGSLSLLRENVMKKVHVILMLVLFGFSLVAAANSYAADSERSRTLRVIPTTPTQQQPLSTPAAPAAGGIPGGSFGQGSYTSGCCQKPGPSGLHCCDTRDCGWFDCGDEINMPQKTYR